MPGGSCVTGTTVPYDEGSGLHRPPGNRRELRRWPRRRPLVSGHDRAHARRPHRARRRRHHRRPPPSRPAQRRRRSRPRSALADAFRAFDADETAQVAVLYGDGGTFCAGADLKAVGDRDRQPGRARRRRPDGADPAAAGQAGHRGDRGVRGRRRTRAGAVVRPAGRRGRRRARCLLPPLGSPPHRRRHGPAPPHRRRGGGDGPRPHRPTGRRRGGGADRAGQPAWSRPARRGRRPRSSRTP